MGIERKPYEDIREDNHLQAKERSFGRNKTYLHLNLGLLVSRIVKELISVV